MVTLSPLSELVAELKAAYEQGLIEHYSLNRCSINATVEYVDLRIALKSKEYEKQDPLRDYLRNKYGLLIRSILIEPF